MSTPIAIEDSAKLLQALDAQHEDWIIARAMEIVERRMFQGREALSNPYATMNFLRLKLAQEPNEVFAALFLDGRNRVIAYEELFRGTVNGATVHPRVVLSKVLQYNAVSLIFSHYVPRNIMRVMCPVFLCALPGRLEPVSRVSEQGQAT